MKQLKKYLKGSDYLKVKNNLTYPFVAYTKDNDKLWVKDKLNYILATYKWDVADEKISDYDTHYISDFYMTGRPSFIEDEILVSINYDNTATYALILKEETKEGFIGEEFSNLFCYAEQYSYYCVPLIKLDFSNAYINLQDENIGADGTHGGQNILFSPEVKEIIFGNNFNTSNLTSMSRMFYRCYDLESLDLSSFDTSNVTGMSYMFTECYSLSSITFGDNWNTSNVTNMDSMFSCCESIHSMDLSAWDLSKVESIDGMFVGSNYAGYGGSYATYTPTALDSLTIMNELPSIYGNQDIFSPYSINCIFNYNCENNYNFILNNFYGIPNPLGCEITHLVKVLDYEKNTYLTNLNLTLSNGIKGIYNADLGGYTFTFENEKDVVEYDILQDGVKIDTLYTYLDNQLVIKNCSYGVINQIIDIKTQENINLINQLYVNNLIKIYVDGTELSPNYYHQFTTNGIKYVNIIFDTNNTLDMSKMFNGCSKLNLISFTENFDTSNVINMNGMFNECTNLRNIKFNDKFITSNVSNMNNMFAYCYSLSTLDLSSFDTSKVTDMNGMFTYSLMKKIIGIEHFNTSNVTNMSNMFNSAYHLLNLDLSSWNTINVTTMNYMFAGCCNLEILELDGWNTLKVTDMYEMFSDVHNLEVLDISSFDFNDLYMIETLLTPGYRFSYYNYSMPKTHTVVCKCDYKQYFYEIYYLQSNGFNVKCKGDITLKVKIFKNGVNLTSGNVSLIYTNLEYNDIDELWVTTFNLQTSENDVDTSIFLDGKKIGNVNLVDEISYIAIGEMDDSNFDIISYTYRTDNPYIVNDEYRKYVTKLHVDGIDIFETPYYIPKNHKHKIQISIDLSTIDSVENLFYQCKTITSITFNSTFDLSNIKSMKNFLYFSNVRYDSGYEDYSDGYYLKEITFKNINTSNVTDMSYMFRGCVGLTNINGLNYFDTSNVTDMSYMFAYCCNLTSLDLSSFDTSNVSNMSYMFYGQKQTKIFDLSSFDTSNVTDMSYMFAVYRPSYVSIYSACEEIIFGDKFNTSLVTTMSNMFYGCNNLTSLDVSNFNTSNVTNMSDMFTHCSMPLLDVSNFSTSNVTDMHSMFKGCDNLSSLDLSSFDTSKVTNMSGMFRSCAALTSLDLSSFDTSNVIDMSDMFNGVYNYENVYYTNEMSLTSLDLSSFDTSKVTNMSGMFINCTALTSLDLSSFDTSKVTNMSGMFRCCYSLVSLDLSNFDTSNVTDMSFMFCGYVFSDSSELKKYMSLITLDLSNFDTSNVIDMREMFLRCNNLTSLVMLGNASKVTSYSKMFNRISTNGTFTCNVLYVDSWNNLLVTNKSTSYFPSTWKINSIPVNQNIKLKIIENGIEITEGIVSIENVNFTYNENEKVWECIFAPTESKYNILYNGNEVYELDLTFNKDIRYVFIGNNDEYHGFSIIETVKSSSSTLINSKHTMYIDYMSVDDVEIKPTASYNFGNNDEHTVRMILKSSDITDMSKMFENCSGVTSITFGDNFDTSNVTDMSYMFYRCKNLSSLDLSSFDTSNVTDMSYMFCGTYYSQVYENYYNIINNIEFGDNFDTSKVTKMNHMFSGCSYLETLDLSSFDTSNVTDMAKMFGNCKNLKSITFSDKFDTSNVTDIGGMFYGCNSLTELDLSSWDTSNVTTIMNDDFYFDGGLFTYCNSLSSITFGDKWNTSNINNFDGVFRDCSSLLSLDLSGWDVSNATCLGGTFGNRSGMFMGCSSLTELDLSSWDTSNVTTMCQLFYGCSSLKTLKLKDKWVSSNVTNIGGMFYGCSSLTELDLSSWDTSNVTSLDSQGVGLFADCHSLSSITFSDKWDISKVYYMDDIFKNCSSLKEIDLRQWKRDGNVYETSEMFNGCSSLTSILFNDNLTFEYSYMMFANCTSLTEIDLSKFNISYMYGMFSGCTSLENVIFGDNWDVTELYGAFSGCTNLKSVTFNNNWNTSNLSGTTNMFANCTSLESVNFNDVWNTSKLTTMKNMFSGCTSLTSLDLSNIDIYHVTNFDNMFNGCTNLSSIIMNGELYSIQSYNNMFSDISSTGMFKYPCNYDYTILTNILPSEWEYDCNVAKDITFKFKIINNNTEVINGDVTVNDVTSTFLQESGYWVVTYDVYNLTSEVKLNGIVIGEISNLLDDKLQYIFIGDCLEYVDITATYITTVENETIQLLNDSSDYYQSNGVSEIVELVYVDNKPIKETMSYKFTTIGEHNVKIMFKETTQTVSFNKLFENNDNIISVKFGGKYIIERLNYVLNSANNVESVDLSSKYMSSLTKENYNISSGFQYCNSLTYVTLPKNIDDLNSSPFYGCTSLSSITIPNSVEYIGEKAFSGCTNLKNIIFEEGSMLNFINYSAFTSCVNLISIEIPNGVTSIGNYAFNNCDSLTSIIIPNSVTSIGSYAFSKCDSLTSIIIPESVTSIGSYAFSGCCFTEESFQNNSSLTSYNNWGAKIIDIKTEDGLCILDNKVIKCQTIATNVTIPSYITEISSSAFSGCTSLSSVTFEEGSQCTSIGNYAFYNCKSLVSIEIPNSATSIGNYAFYKCSSLSSITIPESVESIGQYAFSYCESLSEITIPNDVKTISYRAFEHCYTLTSITIPNSVESISNYAFNNCDSLTSIIIPNSVKTISASAFTNCYSLSSVTFEEGSQCTSIGSYAFYYCRSLREIEIPNGVTSINSYLFTNCTSLTSITIPNSVTSIGSYAFNNCDSLSSFTIPNSVTTIGSYAFNDCDSLSEVTIHSDVTSIGDYAFNSCKYLSNITFGEDLKFTSFNKGIFSNCVSLVHFIIPNGINSISNNMFDGCSSLASVTIPESVTSIGSSAFRKCISLIEFIVPNTINTIGSSAFTECYSLSSVIFEEGSQYTSIGSYAFYNCDLLTSIEIPSDVTSISDHAFASCESLSEITIPSGVTSIGSYAFYECNKLNKINLHTITAPTLGNYTFYNISSNGTLYIPTNSDYSSWLTNSEFKNWITSITYTLTECTSLEITAENVNGMATSTIISYTATTNGVDYDGNSIYGITITGTAISEKFDENTSYIDTIEREIIFEYMGVTASTIITQYALLNKSYYIDLNNQWKLSTTVNNPDISLYDGVYETDNNVAERLFDKCTITIEGYKEFILYVSAYIVDSWDEDLIVVSNLDCELGEYTTSGKNVKTTSSANTSSKKFISDYKKVIFKSIDGGRHNIQIMFKQDYFDNKTNDDKGYLLIPKNQ